MAYEQRDMSGSLFKNTKREKDTHPNARGSAKIGGVEYWVDAWTKQDKNGNPWQSLSFKLKDAQPAAKPQSAGKRGASAFDGMDDDIPL